MPEKAQDVIPPDILQAARDAGIPDPIWYVGRRMRKGFQPTHGLGKVVREAREQAGQAPAVNTAPHEESPSESAPLPLDEIIE